MKSQSNTCKYDMEVPLYSQVTFSTVSLWSLTDLRLQSWLEHLMVFHKDFLVEISFVLFLTELQVGKLAPVHASADRAFTANPFALPPIFLPKCFSSLCTIQSCFPVMLYIRGMHTNESGLGLCLTSKSKEALMPLVFSVSKDMHKLHFLLSSKRSDCIWLNSPRDNRIHPVTFHFYQTGMQKSIMQRKLCKKYVNLAFGFVLHFHGSIVSWNWLPRNL